MIRNIRLILIFIGVFIFIGAKLALAEINPELIKALNMLLVWDTRLIQQCENHSEQFSISFPYDQIISEKQQTMKALTKLIDSFDADISDQSLEVEKAEHDYQALNMDAKAQIAIISIYDNILSKFGHPKVQAFALKAKNQAYIHYMMLSTAAQQILGDNKVEETAKVKKP